MSLNGAPNTTYEYDVIDRLIQLTDNASLNTTFAYDATDKLTSRTLPNGVVSTHQYDGLDRLTRLTHAKNGNTLADFQYQFNTVNNITQMIDNAGTHNYSYDPLDRLTAGTHPNQPNESYSYDDVGNRTASHQGSSYTYQPFNRLVTANGASIGYDTNGNRVSKTDASNAWIYTWDYENRLKQASLSGAVFVTYSYDALGRRIQRTSSLTGTTKFVYDGPDVVRDLDGSGNTTADYLNSLGIDNKLRQTVSGNASYFIADHVGTTRSVADSHGNVSANVGYDSFGNVTVGSATTRYTYTGRELDGDSGLIYYRARWYDAGQGRFLAEDPIGFRGGDINLYAYVGNTPLTWTDPDGTQIRSAERNRPGDKEWADNLRKQMASWPSPPNNSAPCPCDQVETEKALKRIAERIGARLGEGWRIENLVNPYDKVVDNLKRDGFEPFFNPNPPHWGGTDLQGQINNRWYHVTVFYPYTRQNKIGRGGVYQASVFDPSKPPPRVDIHCDRYTPSSFDHFLDWLNSWF